MGDDHIHLDPNEVVYQRRKPIVIAIRPTVLDDKYLATWMRALVGGKVLNADYQRRWLDSLTPQDPSKPLGQKYGYGISQITLGPNSLYFHGGRTPGSNELIG